MGWGGRGRGFSVPAPDNLERAIFGPLGAWIIVLAIGASVPEYRRIQRTVYAITDRRVLSMDVASSRAFERYGLCTDVVVVGVGAIYFARARGPGRDRRERVGFIGISDVRAVERLVREMFLRRR